MKGFPVQFNVYADTQEEADRASEAIKAFITAQAQKGVAVTAGKVAAAVERYKDNIFVTSYFR